MAMVKITYRKSGTGYKQTQKDTLRCLGFRRLGQTVEHNDSPSIRGMIAKVSHLVDVQEDSK